MTKYRIYNKVNDVYLFLADVLPVDGGNNSSAYEMNPRIAALDKIYFNAEGYVSEWNIDKIDSPLEGAQITANARLYFDDSNTDYLFGIVSMGTTYEDAPDGSLAITGSNKSDDWLYFFITGGEDGVVGIDSMYGSLALFSSPTKNGAQNYLPILGESNVNWQLIPV